MEEEQAAILAAPHFYWGACLVCGLTAAPGKPLKRCSRCHAIYYCSPDHQKRHWKAHKPLCAHLASAAQAADQETFFCGAAGSHAKEWNLFRRNAVRTATVLLARPLELQEQELVLFPRVCRTAGCHRATGNLLDCSDCHAVTYCSEQHMEEGREQHAAFCRQLRLCRLLDRHEACVGVGLPAIPAHLDHTFLGSAPDISHFIEQPFAADGKAVIKEEAEWAFLTSQLSGPLTLLDTAVRFLPFIGSLPTLTVHVVGANIVEMMGVIKWEYLAHRLPALRSLVLVFVGPELEAESEEQPEVAACPECQALGRAVEYRVHCGTYASYSTSDDYMSPDLLLAQNCGFSEFEASAECPGWAEGWALGLAALVQEAPLVFTSYTRGEAEQDLARLLATAVDEVEVLARCQLNQMRSHRPVRDWEMDQDPAGKGSSMILQERDVFYSNQFLSVVRRSAPV